SSCSILTAFGSILATGIKLSCATAFVKSVRPFRLPLKKGSRTGTAVGLVFVSPLIGSTAPGAIVRGVGGSSTVPQGDLRPNRWVAEPLLPVIRSCRLVKLLLRIDAVGMVSVNVIGATVFEC